MIIFFTLGGGVFITVFVLMIISGIVRELSQNANSFISENIILMVLFIILSALGSIIAAKLWGSMKAIPPLFLMFAQFFFSLIRGLHYITSDPYESTFIMIFAMIIYISALAFNGFVTLATAGLASNKKRVIPMYLAGIVGAVFGLYFW